MEELRGRRLALGLSQADLARALHVDRLTISAWEAGRRKPSMPGLVEAELQRLEGLQFSRSERKTR